MTEEIVAEEPAAEEAVEEATEEPAPAKEAEFDINVD